MQFKVQGAGHLARLHVRQARSLVEDARVGLAGRAGRRLLPAHQQRVKQVARAAARQLAALHRHQRKPYPLNDPEGSWRRSTQALPRCTATIRKENSFAATQSTWHLQQCKAPALWGFDQAQNAGEAHDSMHHSMTRKGASCSGLDITVLAQTAA